MRTIKKLFYVAPSLVFAAPAFAHSVAQQSENPGWEWTPGVVAPLFLSLLMFAVGTLKVWKSAAPGRGTTGWQVVSFSAGWLSLFFALVSPLHTYGAFLFWIHMTQHEVLMLISAPLFVLSQPLLPFIWSLPLSWRKGVGSLGRNSVVRSLWRWITIPFVAFLVHGGLLWIWHVPALFEATLHSESIHAAQHACFLFSALLFWWAILHSRGGAVNFGTGIIFLFATAVHSGALGALLTLSHRVLYPSYAITAPQFGYSGLEDQQLGGLVMWVPAGVIYLAAALIMAAKWIHSSDSGSAHARMRRQALIFSFIFLALPLAQSRADDKLFVTNERDGTISVVSTATETVIGNIPIGGRPRGIRVSPDMSRVYVAVSTPIKTEKPVPPVAKVVAIEPRTYRILKEYQVGTDPEQLAVGSDGKRLYVSNEDAGTASVIDVDTGQMIATLVVGIEPEGAVTSPDGKQVYITSETSNSVAVIDTEQEKVVNNFLVGARPRDAVFSPDGAFSYVTAELGRSVSIVKRPENAVVATVSLPEPMKPAGIVISPDGTELYIAGGRGNCVGVLETRTRSLTKVIPVGERNWGIAISSDGRKLYTANGLSNNLSIIDTSAKSVTNTVSLGDGPWGIAIVQDRG